MLKRDISRTNVMIAAAGGMIGSGWLFSPYISAQIAGGNALIAWIIAAVFMLFIALPLCEMGALFPVSGGMTNYPNFTHGTAVGFLFSWISWLSYVVMTPIEIQAILQYLSYFSPGLVIKSTTASTELSLLGYLVAFGTMLFVVIINSFGIKLLAECNKVASLIKFIVPMVASIAFISMDTSFQNIHLDLKTSSGWYQIFTALSTGGVIFAFTGFQNGLILAGEVENPQTNIPIAILGAVLVGFVLYFILQLSFLAAVPAQYLMHGWQQLTFPTASAPLVGLALLVGLRWIAAMLLFDASFSPFGTTLVYTAATSRIVYGMAQHQHLPKFFLKENRYGIPTVTLWANFLVGMFSFLPFPGWQKMVSFLSSCSILSYCIGPICLLAMRQLQPVKHRPFYLEWAYPICYIAFYVCNLMLHWCGFAIQWKLFLAIGIGWLIHMFTRQSTSSQTSDRRALYWLLSYLSAMLLVSYLGEFGGIGWIKFPIDFIWIFLISFVFLSLSVHVTLRPEDCEKMLQVSANTLFSPGDCSSRV